MNGLQGEFVGADYYCFTISPATQNAYYESYSNAYSKLDLGSNVLPGSDGNQRIIFSTDPSEMGRDLSGETYLQLLLHSDSMSGQFRKGEEDVLVSYVPLYTFSGSLVRLELV